MNLKRFEGFVNEQKQELILESVQSSILADIFKYDKNHGSKWSTDIGQILYKANNLQLDKIQDSDFERMSPEDARKVKGRDELMLFWLSEKEKENPHAGEYVYKKVIPAGIIVAVTNGDYEFIGKSRHNHLNKEKKARNVDSLGGVDTSGGKDGTGIKSIKRVAEVSDVVYAIDFKKLGKRLATSEIKSRRAEQKTGATALMSDKDFRKKNMARYKEIIRQQYSSSNVDEIVFQGIEILTDMIKDGLRDQRKERGEIILGEDPRGRNISINDVNNFMSNFMRDFESFTRAETEAAKYSDEGTFGNYSRERADEYRKTILDKFRKIENKDIVW